MDLKVDVDGIDKTLNSIKRDLHRGMENSVDTLVDTAKDRAREVINRNDAIFNAEVYKGFKDAETSNSAAGVSAKVYNTVEHADALEHGAEYGDKGPPVEALLPWVARKMQVDGSFDPDAYRGSDDDGGSGGDGSSDDGGDGESTVPNKDSPEEEKEDNWEILSSDFDEAKKISEGTIVKNQYIDAPLRRIDDGLILGWNRDQYKIRPLGSEFEIYQDFDNGEGFQFVDTISSSKYYPSDDYDTRLGYKLGTDDQYGYEIYRPIDLPEGTTENYVKSRWDSISDFENKIGREVVYRTNDGVVHEGEVGDTGPDGVRLYEYGTNYSTLYSPPEDKFGNNDVKLLAVERIDDGKNVPLYGYEQDDVSLGDTVFVEGNHNQNALEVITINESTIEGLRGDGTAFIVDYEDIITTVSDSPVSGNLDFWETGDRVTFYDRDTDEFIDIILTGEIAATPGNVSHYEALDAQTGNQFGAIPQSLFVEWESAPDFDESQIAQFGEEKVNIPSADIAREELIYPNQEVLAYNPIEGDTQRGFVIESPWENQLNVELESGQTVEIDYDSNWSIRAKATFDNLSEGDKLQKINYHFENRINFTGQDDRSDKDFVKDRIRNQVFEGYTDGESFSRVFFGLTEINLNTKRAHAGSSADSGWELQMAPEPNNQKNRWDRILVHEFGHGYTKDLPGSTEIYEQDPEEHDFTGPWPDRYDSKYNHMYEEGLPDWEFDSSNPIHGYKEMYMFTPGSGNDKVTVKNGKVDLDSRNELSPYGVDEWGDEVAKIAKADARGESVVENEMDFTTKEITDKQVFGSDEFSVDEGDFIVLTEDGEDRVYEFTGRDGTDSSFSPNSDEPDIPSDAEAIALESVGGDFKSMYVGTDGKLYDTYFDASGTGLTYLTENEASFKGLADVSNLDYSLDEIPDLVSDDKETRLHEAANMAWWYQAKHIEYDNSQDKERSKEIVMSDGYSSAIASEVMSTFVEAMTMENISLSKQRDLKMLARNYPYFIEAFLKERKPVSDQAKKVLEDEGLL